MGEIGKNLKVDVGFWVGNEVWGVKM